MSGSYRGAPSQQQPYSSAYGSGESWGREQVSPAPQFFQGQKLFQVYPDSPSPFASSPEEFLVRREEPIKKVTYPQSMKDQRKSHRAMLQQKAEDLRTQQRVQSRMQQQNYPPFPDRREQRASVLRAAVGESSQPHHQLQNQPQQNLHQQLQSSPVQPHQQFPPHTPSVPPQFPQRPLSPQNPPQYPHGAYYPQREEERKETAPYEAGAPRPYASASYTPVSHSPASGYFPQPQQPIASSHSAVPQRIPQETPLPHKAPSVVSSIPASQRAPQRAPQRDYFGTPVDRRASSHLPHPPSGDRTLSAPISISSPSPGTGESRSTYTPQGFQPVQIPPASAQERIPQTSQPSQSFQQAPAQTPQRSTAPAGFTPVSRPQRELSQRELPQREQTYKPVPRPASDSPAQPPSSAPSLYSPEYIAQQQQLRAYYSQRPLAAQAVNLVKQYGEDNTAVTALKGINVGFGSGMFTAIMGPSGSGKSTLMHCLAGLDSATTGQAFIGNTDVSSLTDAQLTELRRDRLGFIFQAFNLVPTLTAAENITLPSDIAGRNIDRAWFNTITERLGLSSRLNHRPSELSGGQQQRVACARALVSRPEIIFGDEPTGNLDSNSSAEVLKILRTAVDTDGQTVVIVTHDAKAASYADRVVFLADGAIVQELYRPSSEDILRTMTQIEDRL